jgi:hypothetical protein
VDTVDADVVPGELLGSDFGQATDAPLAGPVGSQSGCDPPDQRWS